GGSTSAKRPCPAATMRWPSHSAVAVAELMNVHSVRSTRTVRQWLAAVSNAPVRSGTCAGACSPGAETSAVPASGYVTSARASPCPVEDRTVTGACRRSGGGTPPDAVLPAPRATKRRRWSACARDGGERGLAARVHWHHEIEARQLNDSGD